MATQPQTKKNGNQKPAQAAAPAPAPVGAAVAPTQTLPTDAPASAAPPPPATKATKATKKSKMDALVAGLTPEKKAAFEKMLADSDAEVKAAQAKRTKAFEEAGLVEPKAKRVTKTTFDGYSGEEIIAITSMDKAGFSDKYKEDAKKIAASTVEENGKTVPGMRLKDVLELESVEGMGWVYHRVSRGSITIDGRSMLDFARKAAPAQAAA